MEYRQNASDSGNEMEELNQRTQNGTRIFEFPDDKDKEDEKGKIFY
jgi:hypothetical protein